MLLRKESTIFLAVHNLVLWVQVQRFNFFKIETLIGMHKCMREKA